MKTKFLLLSFLLLTLHSFAQTTLYSEDFTGQNGKGAFGGTAPGNIDLVGVDWDIDVSSATLAAGGNPDYFYVLGEQFAAEDTDGIAIWLSPSIAIDGFSDVSFSLDASTNGSNDNNDRFRTDYRINGGPWTTAATNGNLRNDFNLVVSQSGLTGNTLEIRIGIRNNQDNDITFFDNILVTGIPVPCPAVSGITVNSTTNTSASISWTAGDLETAWEVAVQPDGTGLPSGSGTATSNNNPYIATGLLAQTAYEVYVRANCGIDGFSDWAGPVAFNTLTNDLCVDATPITCGATVTGNTTLATDSDGIRSREVFYSLAGTGLNEQITVSLCGSSYDTLLAVYNACDDGSLSSLIAFNDDFCGLDSQLTFTSDGSSTYIIQVDGFDASEFGAFNLEVTCDPLTNDDFANATPISCGNSYIGNTNLATIDEDDAPDGPQSDIDTPNLWYSFIGTGNFVTLSTCANSNFDTEILVYTGTSGNLTFVDEGFDECSNVTYEAETTFNAVLGTTYYISIDGWEPGDSGIFELQVSCTGLPPTPQTYTYTNGWDADPNGVSTSIDIIDVVSGDATISAITACNTLSIAPGASLTVNSGTVLRADGDIGEITLTSTSTSYSSLIVEGSVVGTVIYERHVNAAPGTGASTTANDLISAPLTGQTFQDFSAANTNILSGTIGGSPAFLFGPFNSATNSYTNYSPLETSTLDAGIGYRTGSTDNSTYTFTGNVETGTVSVPLALGGATNWNLIGNPYPSYMNAQAFLNNANNASLIDENAFGIYGYDGAVSDGWTIFNLATTTPTSLLAPGQGFFVEAEAAGSIQFTPGMRRTGSSDDFIVGRNSDVLEFLKLKLNTDADTYHTDFYFNTNASTGLDIGYDASVWNNVPANFSVHSYLVDQTLDTALALQALHSNDLYNVTIPLGVNANANERLVFSILETTLPTSINVYLEDTETETITLLNADNYELTPETDLSGMGRFYLRFVDNALSNDEAALNDLKIYTNKAQQTLILKGQLASQTKLQLFDIQGRVVRTAQLESRNTTHTVDVAHLNAGVYIVQLQNNAGLITQKVIIR